MSSASGHGNELVHASRKEIDSLVLDVIFGEIPKDIYGVCYFSSPVGTIESGGLPYRKFVNGKRSLEYGSPVFNGDGMIIKIDFNTEGKAFFSTSILKTPCYVADEVSAKQFNGQYFMNGGISRLSIKYGVRNQLNTAMLPFRYKGDTDDRILATFDTGRPYEFDPDDLELGNPLGNNKIWSREFEKVTDYVFPMIQTTAHPSFDPNTREFFTVNFTKNLLDLAFPRKAYQYFMSIFPEDWENDTYCQRFTDLAQKGLKEIREAEKEPSDFKKREEIKNEYYQKVLDLFQEIDDKEEGKEYENFNKFFGPDNEVYILKRDGSNRLKKWQVVDEDNQSIEVKESLHQTAVTKDYFIFIDTAFKISLELLMHNPFFWSSIINEFIREITKSKLKDYTLIYIVNRNDLAITDSNQNQVTTVQAKRIKIDLETVHFAVDYDNQPEEVVMHCAHNSSLCAAEWVRPFDRLAIHTNTKGGNRINEKLIGLPTIGEMDISSIGKLTINLKTNTFNHNQIKKFSQVQPQMTAASLANLRSEANTWGIGLFTYKDYLSTTNVPNKLDTIFWQFYGLDSRFLTKYIFDLYDNYQNDVAPKDLLKLTEVGIPFSIAKQDVNTMKLTDHYTFGKDYHFRSLQFVPKKESLESDDGYLVCTMIVPLDENTEDTLYQRQIWIFNGKNLAAGPVCKLGHRELSYAFTIHSAWLPSPTKQLPKYPYNIENDYEEIINEFSSNRKKIEIRDFMENYIYPKFTRFV